MRKLNGIGLKGVVQRTAQSVYEWSIMIIVVDVLEQHFVNTIFLKCAKFFWGFFAH